MKKVFLGISALTMCAALTGCGNSSKNAVNDLSTQLDQTANTISNVQTVNPLDINLSTSTLNNLASKNQQIRLNMANTKNSLATEEQYKLAILDKTETIKNSLSKNTSLSKAQTNAVKELTSSLNRYTNSVAYTKNDLKNTVKAITALKKDGSKSADKLSAKLNRLACNSNARASYYQNILTTLDQLETYVGCPDCNENESQTAETNVTKQTENSYALNNSYPQFNSNNFNRLNGFYGAYGMNGYGNGYMPYGAYGNGYGLNRFGNGYGMNGFGNYGMNGYGNYGMNGYGSGMFNTRFNPTRNTDTYAPLTRNIDTYRYSADEFKNGAINGFGGVVATTEPQQRLETYEDEKSMGQDESTETPQKDENNNLQNKENIQNEESDNLQDETKVAS